MSLIYKDVEALRKSLCEKADQAGADIRAAEEMLQSLPFSRGASFGPIQWNADNRRIMMNGKPLIENKLEPRLDGHFYLNCLLNRVVLETQEAASA